MDRIRESRKSNKLRHRNLEEGAVELREGSRKIGRNHDRELRKRRRGSHSHRDEGDRSIEESFGNEKNDDVRVRIRLSSTTSFGVSDQDHRRSVTTVKPPPFKRTDEIIGVVVPRKARSG